MAPTPAPSGMTRPPPVERWLAEHGDVMWRFVLGRVHSREAAEEIIQETVLAAMQAHARFAGGSTERTWLLAIAANKAADHFRAQRRRGVGHAAHAPDVHAGDDAADEPGRFTPEGMWASPPGAWGLDSRDTPENAELLAALRRCIQILPPSLGEVVWLRDLLGLPGAEVCEAMGISPTNLWSRTHRARAALRACVERSIGLDKEGAPCSA